MSIKKDNPARLRKVGKFYTTLPSETIKSIRDGLSLGIWVYLQSQSDNWVIRATQIQNHFSIGRDKYAKSIRLLKHMKLIRFVVERDDKGRIVDNTLECYSEPFEFIEENTDTLKTRHSAEPAENKASTGCRKNRHPEKPTAGKTDPLIKDQDKSLINDQYLSLSRTHAHVHDAYQNAHVHDARGENCMEGNEINPTDRFVPTPESVVCTEWIKAGLVRCNPSHPELVEVLKAGITVEELVVAGKDAVREEKANMGYAIATAVGRRRDGEKTAKVLQKNPLPNKKIDSRAAYHEAVEQSRLRLEGKDTWSDPAIFWAYKKLGTDLQRYPWDEIKARWFSALDEAQVRLKDGSLSTDIPPFKKTAKNGLKTEICDNGEDREKFTPSDDFFNELKGKIKT